MRGGGVGEERERKRKGEREGIADVEKIMMC